MKHILETKLDHKTLHFLPFLPTRKRTKKFKLKGEWGQTEFAIEAAETVNTYDLITLMFVTKAYLKKNWYAGYLGENEEKRIVAGLELDLVQVCKERGILNKKQNRESILGSLLRLSNINLFFTNKQTHTQIATKYLYEIRYDLEYKIVKIYANKAFVEFISNNGILLNLTNFIQLEQVKAKAKEYAILLYTFLNGTKEKIEYKTKKFLKWREKYTEKLLFQALKLDNTNMIIKEKRRILKESFQILHKELNLPIYIYKKHEKIWHRQDIIEIRNTKIK